MGAVTPTVNAATEFAGKFKVINVTVTLASTSDTVTLTEANTACVSLAAPIGAVIMTGIGANFASLQVSVSGLVATVVSKNAAGSAATSFGDVSLTFLGKTS